MAGILGSDASHYSGRVSVGAEGRETIVRLHHLEKLEGDLKKFLVAALSESVVSKHYTREEVDKLLVDALKIKKDVFLCDQLGGLQSGRQITAGENLVDVFSELISVNQVPLIQVSYSDNLEQGVLSEVEITYDIALKSTNRLLRVECDDTYHSIDNDKTVFRNKRQSFQTVLKFFFEDKDGEEVMYSKNISVKFTPPQWKGSSFYDTIDFSNYIGLSASHSLNKFVDTSNEISLNYNRQGNYVYFVLAKSDVLIKDKNGFDYTSMFTMSPTNVTLADGTTRTYYVYKSTNRKWAQIKYIIEDNGED